MSATAIAILCSVGGLLTTAAALLTRAVLGWSREMSALRLEISALRNEMTKERGNDRIEVRELIAEAIVAHRLDCPARSPGGAGGTDPRIQQYTGPIAPDGV